jgi:hypothetical protein
MLIRVEIPSGAPLATRWKFPAAALLYDIDCTFDRETAIKVRNEILAP